jgi:uridylate kinase
MKKIVVLSLGGSVIFQEEININYLKDLKKILRSFYKTHRFVIVAGGGSKARMYIKALMKSKKSKMDLSKAGIRATRENALFLIQFMGKEANDILPKNMRQVKSNLKKNNLVICGALRFDPESTSDGTAAKIANYLKGDFVNITNVIGLFSSDPRKNKNARFVSNISWLKFEKMAMKKKFKAGQHFVLDQNAARSIRINGIKTYIIGPSIANFKNLLKGNKFKGTTISG